MTMEHSQAAEVKESRDDQSMLRLAVIGTPRSGNTWVRSLLAMLCDLEQIPTHFPHQIDWEGLPRRCVIQIHWYPVEPFVSLLRRHEVRVVVPARHPLDVLMSWLNYAYYVHQEGFCPGKETCDKCDIVGVSPRSEALVAYASGGIGHWILCHSPAWWNTPGVIRIRYEDLVAEPESTLGRLLQQIGETPRRSIAESLEATSIHQMKSSQNTWHYHFWQGQPGLWRSLIPASEARAIAAGIPEPFEILGYPCDPDQALDDTRADLNWIQLQLDSTREHLALERTKHRATVKNLQAVQQQCDAVQQQYDAVRQQYDIVRQQYDRLQEALSEEGRSHEQTRRVLAAIRVDRDALIQRLAPIDDLGPRLLQAALKMKRITTRFQGVILRSDAGAGAVPTPHIQRAPIRTSRDSIDAVDD